MWLFSIFIITKCALDFVANKIIPKKTDEKSVIRKSKVHSQIEEFSAHVISMAYGWPIITKYSLLFYNEAFLIRNANNSPVPDEFMSYYIFLGIVCCYQLIWNIIKPYDFRAKYHGMLIFHHVLTIGLLFFSHMYNFHEFGILIQVLHDTSDVFLDMSKIAKYLKMIKLFKISTICLNIAWIYTRIYLFGHIVYLLANVFVGNISQVESDYLSKIGFVPFCGFFLSLSILYLFNLIWYILMTKITIKIINKNNYDDIDKITNSSYE